MSIRPGNVTGSQAIVKDAWAADAAMLCYARYGAAPMSDTDFRGHLSRAGLNDVRKIGDWTAPGTQGFFASNGRFAFLSFRGTEANDPTDSLDDADSQSFETFVRCHIHAFVALSGVAREIA